MRNSFAKLAANSPFVVRSIAEQCKKEKAMRNALPILESLRKQCNRSNEKGKARNAKLTAAIRQLRLPMFYVEIANQKLAVSASVIADWRKEKQPFVIYAFPIVRQQMRGLNTTQIENEAIENSALARANCHAMGYAQTAWRLAHLEGDTFAERCAYHWLFHGNLNPCRDKQCKACGKRRLQSLELYVGAMRYLEGEYVPKGKRAKQVAHKMAKPTQDELRQAFGDWKTAPNAQTVKESKKADEPLFRLADAIARHKQ